MHRFANAMWDEWISCQPEQGSEAEIETSGIISSLTSSSKDGYVNLKSGRLWVFRRLRRIWPLTCWSEVIDLARMLRIPREMKGKVSIDLTRDIYEDIIARSAVAASGSSGWFWLRGVWGNSGSLYLPKSGHYLVFRSPDRNHMVQIVHFLSRNGIKTSQRSKDTFFETLLRDQQIIVDLLTRFRLYNSSLLLEQRTMVRAMRDRANKLVNCDAANIRKSLEAAQKQIQLSRMIKESGIYADLPSVLKEMIDIRLEYPSATLTELGQYLEKPVSKSTVKYRWKKLQLVADQVLSGYSRLNQSS